MIPEIGFFALSLSFVVSLVQSLAVFRRFGALARPMLFFQAAALATALFCLMAALVSNDFSVVYVAEHSSARLPVAYRLAAAWGGQEGSLLFWAFTLALWALAFQGLSAHLPGATAAGVLGVLGLVASGLLSMLVWVSNPFARALPIPMDGRGLNPLLQDMGLIFHPPLLYLGYSGLALPFALAVNALLSNAPDEQWARASRFWTLAAWIFLTPGILVGAFWAYYELGWGGWWFWDPVENASLMPWLTATALLHALPVAERHGAFRRWCLFLGIAAFALSLLGAFLVRSGVLISVHTFSDAPRGLFFLFFLALVAGSALALFAARAPRIVPGGHFALRSRETFLLAGSALLAVACATVLLGTIYPLMIDALSLGKLSVGAPYFNTVFIPLTIPAILLAGISLLARWTPDRRGARLKTALNTGAFSLAVGLAAPLFFGAWRFLPALGVALAVWLSASSLVSLRQQTRSPASETAPGRLSFRPGFAKLYGVALSHLGLALFVAAVTLSDAYSEEKTVSMAVGETVNIAGHAFRFNGARRETAANYSAVVAEIEGIDAGTKYFPEKRAYPASGRAMTEAAIDFWRNTLVTLVEPADSGQPTGAWRIRIAHKPWINGLWIGGALAVIGGLLSLSGRRRAAQAKAAS